MRMLMAVVVFMAVRMFMISAHYRSPVNFSDKMIEQAQTLPFMQKQN